jgi:Cu/Ag efflux pump CusA
MSEVFFRAAGVGKRFGGFVALAEVDIELRAGVAYIYREDSARYVPLRFSVRGRDPSSAVQEAQATVAARVTLPPGYRLSWEGEFKNLQEAIARLTTIVPVAFGLIAVLLYVQFNNLRETLLVIGIVPLSISGGVAALAGDVAAEGADARAEAGAACAGTRPGAVAASENSAAATTGR